MTTLVSAGVGVVLSVWHLKWCMAMALDKYLILIAWLAKLFVSLADRRCLLRAVRLAMVLLLIMVSAMRLGVFGCTTGLLDGRIIVTCSAMDVVLFILVCLNLRRNGMSRFIVWMLLVLVLMLN